MSTEYALGPARLTVFDEALFKQIDGRAPRGSLVWAPFCVPGALDVAGPDGRPFLRLEVTKPERGERMHFMSSAIVAECNVPTHPLVACTDPAGRDRRLAAFKAWLSTLSPIPTEPKNRFRDEVTPVIIALLDRGLGSFALSHADVVAAVAELRSAPSRAELEEIATRLTESTWPADLQGAALDEDARAAAEHQARSEAARKRNEEVAREVIEFTAGEQGVIGFWATVGTVPPWEILVDPRNATEGRSVVRPPTHVASGRNFWLYKMKPGQPLPLIDTAFAGTVGPDVVFRMSRGQLASIPGTGWDWLFLRQLREAHGSIDRRPLQLREMIGAGDNRYDVVAEQARALIAENIQGLTSPMTSPATRGDVVSAIVRGMLLRPECASELLVAAIDGFASPASRGDPRMHRVVTSGTFNVGGTRGSADALEEEAPAPVRSPMSDWADAACLGAAEGTAEWSWHGPGVLLPAMEPTFLARAATAIGLKADPWSPILKQAIHDRATERFKTEDLVAILRAAGQDVLLERPSDTSRIKRILAGMGFEKREFQNEGVRVKAYAAVAS